MPFQRKKPAAIGAKAPIPGFVEPALATRWRARGHVKKADLERAGVIRARRMTGKRRGNTY
jgi:hypothetical protein